MQILLSIKKTVGENNDCLLDYSFVSELYKNFPPTFFCPSLISICFTLYIVLF